MRTFKVYLPAIYDGQTPRPLVFQFHGVSSAAWQFEIYTKFKSVADTANFILITPNGTVGTLLPSSYGQTWNNIDFDSVDDVLFVSNLIDTLMGSYNIDTTRIYSAGFSNGGFMGYDLACRLDQRIAAIASVGGSVGTRRLTACSPGRAVPVLEIHGTSDPVIPYGGGSFAGISFFPVETVIFFWRDNNQCDISPIISNLPDINTSDGSTVVKYEYPNCADGSEVELLKILNGGHTWPGASGPNTNQDIIADQEIWRFFLRHQLATTTETAEVDTPLEWKVYPNPASDLLTISWNSDRERPAPDAISISDLLGRTILTQRFEKSSFSNEVTINLNSLSSGSYLLLAMKDGQPITFHRLIVLK